MFCLRWYLATIGSSEFDVKFSFNQRPKSEEISFMFFRLSGRALHSLGRGGGSFESLFLLLLLLSILWAGCDRILTTDTNILFSQSILTFSSLYYTVLCSFWVYCISIPVYTYTEYPTLFADQLLIRVA